MFSNLLISSCSPLTKLNYPIIDLSIVKNSNNYLEEIRKERYIYTKKWLICNPIVRIQRWWKKMSILENKKINNLR
jgi:hypothetical protein